MTFTSSSSAIARGINIALGAWLFISAFAWSHSGSQQTNTWIVGALCAFFALIALSYPAARWLNTALSVWLFISVWALPRSSVATGWNNALAAIAVFVLSMVPWDFEGTPAQRRISA